MYKEKRIPPCSPVQLSHFRKATIVASVPKTFPSKTSLRLGSSGRYIDNESHGLGTLFMAMMLYPMPSAFLSDMEGERVEASIAFF